MTAIDPTIIGCRIPALTKKSESWMGFGPVTMVVPLAELVDDIARRVARVGGGAESGERVNGVARVVSSNYLHSASWCEV